MTVAPSETALSEEELLELIPAEARTEDFPGAAAFAAFFVSEYYRMFAEQDPQLFEFMSGDECVFCASSLSSYGEMIAAGGTLQGGQIEADASSATGSLAEDGFWYVIIPVETQDGVKVAPDGTIISQSEGGSGTAYAQLAWVDGHWIASDLAVERA